jgi:hypothetical protein
LRRLSFNRPTHRKLRKQFTQQPAVHFDLVPEL